MTTDVWEFTVGDRGKIELLGRRVPANTNPTELPGAAHIVQHAGHMLTVWTSTGLAYQCRTCDVVSLTRGQLCVIIDRYNDEVNPRT